MFQSMITSTDEAFCDLTTTHLLEVTKLQQSKATQSIFLIFTMIDLVEEGPYDEVEPCED